MQNLLGVKLEFTKLHKFKKFQLGKLGIRTKTISSSIESKLAHNLNLRMFSINKT